MQIASVVFILGRLPSLRFEMQFSRCSRPIKSIAALAVALSLPIGCNPPPRPGLAEISIASRPSPDDISPSASVHSAEDQDGAPISHAKLTLPWETWHVYFMGGKRIGYIHVSSMLDEESGRENVRTTIVDQLTTRRGSSSFVQSLQQVNLAGLDGSLVSFNADLRVGPMRTRFAGRASIDSIALSTIRGIERKSDTIPWSNRYHGFAGVQQSLLADPIKLNDTRRLKVLIPIHNRVGTVDLKCVQRASISTMDGKVHDALEIDVLTTIGDGTSIESTVWVDELGNLLKSYTPSLDLAAILSPQGYALEAISTSVDLLSQTAISITGSLSDPQSTYRAGYLLKPKLDRNGNPLELTIEPQVGQWFRKRDDGSIQLLVSRDPTESDRNGFIELKLIPEIEDSVSGPIIDSVSADVRKLAGLSKATEPRELALDLTRTVKQLIGSGDYSRGFATASQTARDGVGDCTERAVLLAAMLRARDIPARVAVGLIYAGSSEKPMMAYHTWTLAWINSAWLPLDPTSGGLAAADRITLTNSHLADGNEYSSLSPILMAIGRMEIEIVNAKYQPLE